MKQSIIKGIVIAGLVISTVTGCNNKAVKTSAGSVVQEETNESEVYLSDEWYAVLKSTGDVIYDFIGQDITIDEYYNRLNNITDNMPELKYPHEHDNSWDCDECTVLTIVATLPLLAETEAICYGDVSQNNVERTTEAWNDVDYMTHLANCLNALTAILNNDIDTARDTFKAELSYEI